MAPTNEERKAILDQMQNIIYDDAPYDILYYDANLEAYRTDRFAGWQNQPSANGTPLFTYGDPRLHAADRTPRRRPAPSRRPRRVRRDARRRPGVAPRRRAGDASATSSNTTLIIAIVVIVAVIAVGARALQPEAQRRPRAEEE